jgi:hypothetical protein
MKKGLLFFIIFLIALKSNAQFEQKVSINISSGIFKTFGQKLSVDPYPEPMQMPNYKMGFSANGGLQFKISERFSLSADFGIMISQSWYYKYAGSDNNYLYWSFTDTTTGLAYEGENYLDIYNYSFRINPKYYLVQGKKWKPYLFAGININLTTANYVSTLWAKYEEINYLPVGEPVAYNGNLENSFGMGFNPGIGIEYSPNDKFHFFLESGYYFIMLNKDHFKSPELEENFNAVVLQVGLRYCFIKSKDL